MRSLLSLLVVVSMTMGTAGADAPPTKPEGVTILQQAIAKEKEPGALDKALVDLDALVKKSPKQPEAHYARGWVLSRLGRSDDAVAAYDKAYALDATFADAAYNAGVVLGSAKRPKEAAERFDRAFKANPKHIDAAYNAGQSYYDQKLFAKAAERWTSASALAPSDFDIAKKLVQAYVALGKDAEAARAREKVFALKKDAKGPPLTQMKSYVYDQFDVGKHHIYVYETFDTGGTLAYVYEFRVTENETSLGSVNLETSAIIREQGVPYVLGMNKGNQHRTLGQTWNTLPAYKVVKAEAIKVIKGEWK